MSIFMRVSWPAAASARHTPTPARTPFRPSASFSAFACNFGGAAPMATVRNASSRSFPTRSVISNATVQPSFPVALLLLERVMVFLILLIRFFVVPPRRTRFVFACFFDGGMVVGAFLGMRFSSR